jgi:hypothetical protein
MFTDFKIGMDFFMGSAAFLEDKSMTICMIWSEVNQHVFYSDKEKHVRTYVLKVRTFTWSVPRIYPFQL